MGHWTTILAVDNDKWACETYRANFPGVDVRCASVSDQIESLPYADVIIGGPPCQPFSDAGENEGEADERDCIPDFCAAVEHGKPRMFLMENVRGLLKEKHIRYFGRMLTRLEQAGPGYVVQWRVLDAVAYGVPQFRERVFVWGTRKDVYDDGARHQWPKSTHAWPPPDECMFGAALLPGVTVGEALGIPDASNRRIRGSGVIRRDHPSNEPCPTVMQPTGGKSGLMLVGARIIGGGRNHPKDADGNYRRDKRDITDEPSTTVVGLNGATTPTVRQYRWSEAMLRKHPPAAPSAPSPTVQAKYFKGGAEGLLRIEGANGWSGQRILNPMQPGPAVSGGTNAELLAEPRTIHSPCRTISAGSHQGGPEPINNRIREGYIRRLTPLECLRLQSGPDDFKWPDKITKTAMYRIVGNGWASRMGGVFSVAFALVDPKSRTLIDLFSGGGLGAVGWHGRFWALPDELILEARKTR